MARGLRRGCGTFRRAKARESKAEEIAVVVTVQYTNEEYASLFKFFAQELKVKNIFHWLNNPESINEFDGLLLRGDRKPKHKRFRGGFCRSRRKRQLGKPPGRLNGGKIKTVVVAGPRPECVSDLDEKIKLFVQSAESNLAWIESNKTSINVGCETRQIPTKTYIEKAGSFTNFKGLVQSFKVGTTVVPQLCI